MRAFFSTVVLFCFVLAAASAQCIKGDCKNGYGTYLYRSGAKYIGNFQNGKIHGQGILQFSNGDRYAGDWQDQHRQGRGRYTFKNGDVYVGDFQASNFQGQGEMHYANGDRYMGQWLDSAPNGMGLYSFANGNLYEGNLRNGIPEGEGKMIYTDGSTYKGFWMNGNRHGQGVLIKSNGQIIKDEWIDDQRADAWTYSPADTPKPAFNDAVNIWAVVVGVSGYDHMPSLRFTDDDAYQVYAFFKSPEGGAIPDHQIKVLIDENATYRNILATLRKTLWQADENDVALFYFSGHGLTSSFLPVDYDGKDRQVLHRDIRDILEQSRAKHKIVIADACHSGGYYAMRSVEVDKDLQRYYDAFNNSAGGTALLLSSKEREYSLEDGGLRSGVFSHFIIKGLKGHADIDSNKIVTIQELYDYARAKVRHYTANMQTPLLTGAFDPNMPIAVIRK